MLTWCTARIDITDVSRWTRALDDVIASRAFELPSAWIVFAWIFTALIDAGFVGRAIGVAATSQSLAGDSWVASVSGRTFAHCLMIYSIALGLFGAESENGRARWDASVLDAGVSLAAFSIRSAAGDCEKKCWFVNKIVNFH